MTLRSFVRHGGIDLGESRSADRESQDSGATLGHRQMIEAYNRRQEASGSHGSEEQQ